MKIQTLALATGVFLALSGFNLSAKTSDEPSAISAYAGRYNGTVILSGSGMAYPGSTQASFRASKKKEIGTLSLTSVINAGGTPTPVFVSYSIRKKSLTYTLSISGSGSVGTGSVKVKSKRITYSATLPIPGGLVYQVFGTVTLSKNGLRVDEILNTGSSTAFFAYSLRKSGKKN